MAGEFQVKGKNAAAPFTLKVHRGDGMALLAMNWRNGQPPNDFVGFAIEYRVPGGTRFLAVHNRIAFPGPDGALNPNTLSSRLSPIQKFRWVHFPFTAEISGAYTYMVTPVFMDDGGQLSYGAPQTADIELRRDTYPGVLNVAYTRGFVSSQAFVDRYEKHGPISTLLPENADDGLTFTPTHPKTRDALNWMGFEARHAIYETLDEAIADPTAKVFVVAYDQKGSSTSSGSWATGSRSSSTTMATTVTPTRAKASQPRSSQPRRGPPTSSGRAWASFSTTR